MLIKRNLAGLLKLLINQLGLTAIDFFDAIMGVKIIPNKPKTDL